MEGKKERGRSMEGWENNVRACSGFKIWELREGEEQGNVEESCLTMVH